MLLKNQPPAGVLRGAGVTVRLIPPHRTVLEMKCTLSNYRVLSAIGVVSICSCPASSMDTGSIRLVPPIDFSEAEIHRLADEIHKIDNSERNVIIRILGGNDSGVVAWATPVGELGLDSQPIWLTNSGAIKSLGLARISISANDLIWQRKVPLSKMIWFTTKQLDALFEQCKRNRPAKARGVGVRVLRRTSEGIVIRLILGGRVKHVGSALCISDTGGIHAPNPKLGDTTLTWQKIRMHSKE